jgi:hypothetical protein
MAAVTWDFFDNNVICDIVGYQRVDLVGTNTQKIHPPDTVGPVAGICTQVKCSHFFGDDPDIYHWDSPRSGLFPEGVNIQATGKPLSVLIYTTIVP